MPITRKRKLQQVMPSSSCFLPPPPPTTVVSSSSASNYDIFLSFRGEDTRKNFTSHLFGALKHHGYHVFHDTLLKRGERVSSELLKAIEDSKLSIVVFSNKYADSRWCLDELVKIMDCHRSSQQIVLPVFYDVEPSHVRNQSGHYAAVFTDHEQIHETGHMNKWKAALNEAGNLSGLHLQNDSNGDEADFIQKIVEQVADSLDEPYLHVADYAVGIDSHVQKLNGLLNLGTDDVRVVAIWGLGGIGKTTIAKAIFNKIYRFFQGSCFLADVRETAKQPNGIITLQERLISDVLKQSIPKLSNFHQGIEVIKQRLWRRKVLVVLDDVDSITQLENLAINLAWLPQGSRVIVTTRDKSCVSSLDAKLYEPEPLNENNSLKLFKRYAFGKDYPKEVYKELSEKVVEYAGGLPLVLKTLGPYMKSLATVEEWQKALERLKIIPPHDVQEKLKLSFNSLADREKELFLDIVCFFIETDKDFMFQVLAENAPAYYPEFEFKVLVNRCLVKIDMDGEIWVHDMLRDMGTTIAREESLNDPEKHSRLWHPEDVLYVLKESLGKKATESIILELDDSNEECVDINAFAKMSKLRLIRFRHLNLVGSYNSMLSLDKLKWLSWYGFPLTCIPSNLDLRNLVALHLQYSRLRQLWKGTKALNKLKFLDVSNSYFLTSLPDFSGVVNLEKLWLCNCKNLVEIHHSIGRLNKLLVLDLSGCYKLFKKTGFEVPFSYIRHLFSSILPWKSLPKSRASNFPSTCTLQVPSSLTTLNLSDCNLTHLPIEIGSLVSLEFLDLSGNKFSSIPASIKDLHRLQLLEVDNCSELRSIADLPNNLFLVTAEECESLETVQIISKTTRQTLITVTEGTKLIENIFTCKEQLHALSRIHVCVTDTVDDEIPHWFNYQGVGPFISFVVPQHHNRSIDGCIIGVLGALCLENNNKFWDYMVGNIFNKTKDMLWTVFINASRDDKVPIMYVEFSKYGIVMEGGEEIEILFVGTSLASRCGIRLVYNEDEDEDVEIDEQLVIQYSPDVDLYNVDEDSTDSTDTMECLSDDEDEDVEIDEQLVIQYSPDVDLCNVDEDSTDTMECLNDDEDEDMNTMEYLSDDEDEGMNTTEYVSPKLMASIKPMLDDFRHFDEEALFVLIKNIAAGGGHSIDINEHGQVYRCIANALYTRFVQSSTNCRSYFLEAMEKDIKS